MYPDWNNMSLLLSEVLEDIGISDKLVEVARRSTLLRENIKILQSRLLGHNFTCYYYGSNSEGTTTYDLKSDVDCLVCLEHFNIIENLRNWRMGATNFRMIEDETTSRGYCLLQVLRNDKPLPETGVLDIHHIRYRQNRILVKNSFLGSVYKLLSNRRVHGPAASRVGGVGYVDEDLVAVFPCCSLHSVRHWLSQPAESTWPTDSLRRQIANSRCYVAPVGCRGSANEELEWRISTSEAERCLMFSLNITQIRVYVLMKMLLKEKINVKVPEESKISSYMCKTVLFHCIAFTPSCKWVCHNLITCLTYCLHVLRNCVLNEYCAHFIIPSSNIMLRRFKREAKDQLRINMNMMLHDIFHNGIFTIKTDYLSVLLQRRVVGDAPDRLRFYRSVWHSDVFRMQLFVIVVEREDFISFLTEHISKLNCQMQLQKLTSFIQVLGEVFGQGNLLKRITCTFLAQSLFTQVASMLASASIQTSGIISPQALQFFYLGIDKDVASSRLKLATVFYCIGDYDKTELILNDAETRYGFPKCEPVCRCNTFPRKLLSPKVLLARSIACIEKRNGNDIKDLFACCVKFLPSEVLPRELKYEMFRSTHEDLACRDLNKYWMDWAVIDSLPYLYFLKYKTYGNLRKPADQERALRFLKYAIFAEPDLGHRETALNLLGQCFEQENRYMDALNCYMMSLSVRKRHNVASLHICRVLNVAFVAIRAYKALFGAN